MRTLKTHFEQIPVDVVKQIAEIEQENQEPAEETQWLKLPTKKRSPLTCGDRSKYIEGQNQGASADSLRTGRYRARFEATAAAGPGNRPCCYGRNKSG